MRRVQWSLAVVCLLAPSMAPAQSTFGTVLGTVRDASGAAVASAAVKVTNLNENTQRETITDNAGGYEVRNLKPGAYEVTVTAPGFQSWSVSQLALDARQTLRVDAGLKIGEITQTVNVEGTAGVITTDTQTISSSLDSNRVLQLPANVRAGGSTSPYALISTLPGVQSDNGNSFSLQGGVPAQSETTVDGISTYNVGGNSTLREMFPSVESIAEIRVQGVGNGAEYGQVGDITTISKSGTNDFHGGVFWYHQNRALDARSYGQNRLPNKIGNTFGATAGGPVIKDKTFFYGTYEGMRFPRQSTVQNTVPTDAMRRGDFNGEGVVILDPTTGLPFPGNAIPDSRISPVAKAIMPFYPLPNTGRTDRMTAANFVENRSANIDSNHYDIRIDHYLTKKQSIFGRWTWKDIPRLSANSLTFESDTVKDQSRQLVLSHNYAIAPAWLNEFRFGMSLYKSGNTFPFDGRAFTNSLGLKNIGPDFPFNGLPNFSIDRMTSFSKSREGTNESWNFQANNNTTWTRGRHTVKFGVDIRRLRTVSPLGFTTGNNYGDYVFQGAFTRSPFADFLLGIPTGTGIAVVQQDNDGRSWHYKGYIQDSWRVSQSLTLELGLRYELHPGFRDASDNIANFDRNVPVTGRVIIPSSEQAASLVAPGFKQSVNACPAPAINGVPCTPILTAKEAGLPEGIRETDKNNFLPRFGFAYRPFGDAKTVVRGGIGVYNMTMLGAIFYSLTGTVTSDVRQFVNVGADGMPVFQFPDTRTPGSGVRAGSVGTFQFRTANQIDFRDPYSIQWNLSVDREVGQNTGVRLSYIAMRSVKMPWAPDLNMPQPSTNYFSQRPLTDRPFPNWDLIYSRDGGANAFYSSFQAEVNRRFSNGLTFTGAYTLAKNLADNAGPAPTGFAGETGGGRVANSLDRRADRGNVYATRRHRGVFTGLYELPFGKGRSYMRDANRFVDGLLGGWRLSSILMLQTGPYLTPTMSVGDPSGTNATSRGTQRPDRTGSGSLDSPDRTQWLDRNAFVCPGRAAGASQFNCQVGVVPGRDPAPIGRFGNSGVGILLGPGSLNLSMGLAKSFVVTEKVKLTVEGSFTNLPNWTNLADPVLNVVDNNFGRITSARGAEFGGGRTGQVSARFDW